MVDSRLFHFFFIRELASLISNFVSYAENIESQLQVKNNLKKLGAFATHKINYKLELHHTRYFTMLVNDVGSLQREREARHD